MTSKIAVEPNENGGVGGLKSLRPEDGERVNVGKRGSIIIPADMVSQFGINADDGFSIRKSKSGLTLKKV